MLPDDLVLSLRAAVLTRPDGRDLASIEAVEVDGPVQDGGRVVEEIRFQIVDLQTELLFQWTVPGAVLESETTRAGAEISVWTVREALARLFLDRTGEFEFIRFVGEPSTTRPEQSGGDVEGSSGPGDPDLDF